MQQKTWNVKHGASPMAHGLVLSLARFPNTVPIQEALPRCQDLDLKHRLSCRPSDFNAMSTPLCLPLALELAAALPQTRAWILTSQP